MRTTVAGVCVCVCPGGGGEAFVGEMCVCGVGG